MDTLNILSNATNKFVEYKYIISEFFIIIDGKQEKFPTERITDFKIEHFYEEAKFPILKLNLLMEKSLYYRMMKKKENVKFKLRLQSYYIKNGTTERSMLKDVFNSTFCMFPTDDIDSDIDEQVHVNKDTNELEELDQYVELFLFKDVVLGLRSTINTILTNCNLSTAVVYLLSKAGVKNVLMSPIENSKVFKELVIPPLQIDRALDYLNNVYGLHRKGTLIYFGLLHSYILNYNGSCTAWYNNEWKETVIYVLSETNPSAYVTGSVLKDKEQRYYYIASAKALEISNKGIIENAVSGTDVVVVDMKNSNTTSKSSNVKSLSKANSKVLFNYSSNPYMAEVISTQESANSTTVTLALENAYIESFNPNKVFSLVFENTLLNTKYKGTYRISNAIHTFTKSGDSYSSITAITLKCVK